MTLAGLKKCVPITACGRFVAPASASMSSVEVLVASSAPGRAAASSCASTSFLSAMLSKTASMMTSAVSKPAVPTCVVMRPSRSAAASGVKRPFFTELS
jgi:hypothetical protein